jgi:DNA-binding response OmpR family regulator
VAVPLGRILVIEDNEDLAFGLRNNLEIEGYGVELATDGRSGLSRAREFRPDLIVLDLMLPSLDGYRVLRELRQDGNTVPVVILTARTDEADKIRGFRLGADDYVTKPFSPRELVLRVQAILRRGALGAGDREVNRFGGGALVIDESRRVAEVRGAAVDLTPTEWGILVALATVPGRVYSRLELINRVRGYEFEGYERTVDSHVKNLRRKIEKDQRTPEIIQTVLGGGYRLGLTRDG